MSHPRALPATPGPLQTVRFQPAHTRRLDGRGCGDPQTRMLHVDERSPPIPPKAEAIAERELARRTRRNAWDQKVSPYLYISPFFILFALVGLFPLALHGLRVGARLEPDRRQG